MHQQETFAYYGQDGVRYDLTAFPQRVILSEEGLGMPEINYVTQRGPFQHGQTMRSFFLGPRIVRLRIRHQRHTRCAYWEARAALLSGIRPNRGSGVGRLRKRLATGAIRELSAIIQEGPRFEARDPAVWDSFGYTETLLFVAHNPVWYDPVLKTTSYTPIAVATFPMTFPVTFLAYIASSTIAYAGTWDEYPTITITGPLKNPAIENTTTGERIALNTTIPVGFTAVITLKYDLKTVIRSDGLNLIGTLASNNDLATFHLQPGANVIVVSGDLGSAVTRFRVDYYERYIGI